MRRHYLIWILIVVGLAGLAGPASPAVGGGWAAPATGAIPLAEYWRRVGETRTLVSHLQGTSPAEQHAQLLRCAGEWAQVTEITLPNGQRQPIATTFLIGQLSADPPDLRHLLALLTTLQEATDQWISGERVATDLAPLHDILASPEFATPDTAQNQLLDQLWRRFWSWVASWLPQGDVAVGAFPSFFQWLCPGLAGLVLVLVLVYAFRGVFASFIAEAEAKSPARDGEAAVTAEVALQRAQRLSAAGDYRTAVRYLYLTALLTLEERGLLRYNRSQTNREYLRSVAQRPELAAKLREVVEVFDQVWYGYQPIDEARYQSYAAQVAALQRER